MYDNPAVSNVYSSLSWPGVTQDMWWYHFPNMVEWIKTYEDPPIVTQPITTALNICMPVHFCYKCETMENTENCMKAKFMWLPAFLILKQSLILHMVNAAFCVFTRSALSYWSLRAYRVMGLSVIRLEDTSCVFRNCRGKQARNECMPRSSVPQEMARRWPLMTFRRSAIWLHDTGLYMQPCEEFVIS